MSNIDKKRVLFMRDSICLVRPPHFMLWEGICKGICFCLYLRRSHQLLFSKSRGKEDSMNPNVVSFHYVLKDKVGKTIESSHNSEPVMFMEGTSQILPGLEAGIKG